MSKKNRSILNVLFKGAWYYYVSWTALIPFHIGALSGWLMVQINKQTSLSTMIYTFLAIQLGIYLFFSLLVVMSDIPICGNYLKKIVKNHEENLKEKDS